MRPTEKGVRLRTPKGVESWFDRLGKPVFYYRPTKKGPRVRLPGLPYSPEFMAVYNAASTGKPVAVAPVLPSMPQMLAAKKSILLNQAIAHYYESPNFLDEYAESTRDYRKRMLTRFAGEGSDPVRGERPLADLTKPDLTRILDEYKSRHTARSIEKALVHFFQFCMLRGLVEVDPTKDIEVRAPLTDESAGFYAWEESDADKFKRAYPLGTKARLVFAIASCLGLRRTDIVKFGPDHIVDALDDDGNPVKRVKYLANKTRRSSGFVLECDVLPELQEAIDACGPHPAGKPFLRKANGNVGWVASSLSGQMRTWCDDAGLPECSTHGLRKLCTTRLVDAECDPFQIQAITGHKNIRVLMKYIEKRNRKKAADAALAKLAAAQAKAKAGKLRVIGGRAA